MASSVFEVSIHIGGAFAIAILATTLAAVSTDAQDPAGYTAAWLAGAFMTVVGAVACAALLRPPGPELTSTNASRCP